MVRDEVRACSARVLTADSTASRAWSVLGLNSRLSRELNSESVSRLCGCAAVSCNMDMGCLPVKSYALCSGEPEGSDGASIGCASWGLGAALRVCSRDGSCNRRLIRFSAPDLPSI